MPTVAMDPTNFIEDGFASLRPMLNTTEIRDTVTSILGQFGGSNMIGAAVVFLTRVIVFFSNLVPKILGIEFSILKPLGETVFAPLLAPLEGAMTTTMAPVNFLINIFLSPLKFIRAILESAAKAG